MHKLSLTLPGLDLAHAVAVAWQDLVVPAPQALTVFEEKAGWCVEAYYAGPPGAGIVAGQLSEIVGRSLPDLAAEAVPDLDWVAISQAALPPVRAGRFRVHGSHDRGRVARGPCAILIDAGEAFGTAHHPTTLGCLRAIDRLVRRRAFAHVLDLGCGSGVLAIAAARVLPRARVVASDLDARSVEVAGANIRANGTEPRTSIVRAAGLAHPRLRRQHFDLVIANILAGPLIALAPRIAGAVEGGGVLVLSGLLVAQAPAVIAAYRSAGFVLKAHERAAGWSTLSMKRRDVRLRGKDDAIGLAPTRRHGFETDPRPRRIGSGWESARAL